MTFEKQDVVTDFYAGNTKDLTVTVYVDEAKTQVKDLAGAEITWALFDDDNVTFMVKSSSDATQISVPTPGNGICIIHLLPPDTVNLYGTYRHHVNVVDANGDESTVLTGKVRIFKSFARRFRNETLNAYLEGG